MICFNWSRGDSTVKNAVIVLALIVASLVVVSQIACVYLPHVNPQYRWEDEQRATSVHVESICGGRSSRGVGVVISERHVLTAYHVTECAEIPKVYVTLNNGDRHWMAVVKERASQDIAKLELMHAGMFNLNIPPPVLAQPWVPQSDDWVCAWPFQKPKVCGLRWTPNMFANRMVHGDSGSAVYDYGALVGLVVRDYPPANTTILTIVTSDWLEGT